MNNISFVIQLYKDLNEKAETYERNILNSICPLFIWLLQDFSMELKDIKGNIISSNEYLENFLFHIVFLIKSEKNRNNQSDLKIKKSFTSIFKNRECITLVSPSEDKSDQEDLSKIPFNKLNPLFLAQFSVLKEKIFKNIQPKIVEGIEMDGNTIVGLISYFVEVINKGSSPNIIRYIESLIETKILYQFEKSKYYFLKAIKQLGSSSISNFEDFNLYRYLQNIKENSVSILNECLKYVKGDQSNLNNIFNNQILMLENLMADNESEIIKKNIIDSEKYFPNLAYALIYFKN